jgi:SET domain-containing protein
MERLNETQLTTLNTSIAGLNDRIRIDKSPIHGYGLFAKEKILKGTAITKYEGTVLTRDEFKKKYGNDIQYCCYSNFPWLPVIVAKEHRNAITYCNESMTPNCIIKSYWLTANKNIDVGEELTLRYNKKYPRDYWLDIPSTG